MLYLKSFFFPWSYELFWYLTKNQTNTKILTFYKARKIYEKKLCKLLLIEGDTLMMKFIHFIVK